MPGRTAITIGNFDGVHLGHRALIRHAREAAGDSGRVIALAFDPHPATRLRPDRVPPRLSEFSDREVWLRQAGADMVVRLEPTGDLLARTPREFIAALHARFRPDVIVEGPNFQFGRSRAGDVGTLRMLAQEFGFQAVVAEPVKVELLDASVVVASSTIARWLLAQGRPADAARVLGRAHDVPGTVQPGDRRGRLLGVPTANVRSEVMLPADGVYVGTATDPVGRRYAAAINVGRKPTFGGGRERACEAHLIGYAGPFDDYGWATRVSFTAFLRDEMRFDGPAAVAAQIRRDLDRVRDFVLLDPVSATTPTTTTSKVLAA